MKKVVVTIDEFTKISDVLTLEDSKRAENVFNCFMLEHQSFRKVDSDGSTTLRWAYAALIKYGYTLGVRTERAKRKVKTDKMNQREA